MEEEGRSPGTPSPLQSSRGHQSQRSCSTTPPSGGSPPSTAAAPAVDGEAPGTASPMGRERLSSPLQPTQLEFDPAHEGRRRQAPSTIGEVVAETLPKLDSGHASYIQSVVKRAASSSVGMMAVGDVLVTLASVGKVTRAGHCITASGVITMETEAPATTASTVTTAAEPPLKSSTQAAQHKSASVRTAPGVRADPQVESHSSAAHATLASCASGTGNTSTATGTASASLDSGPTSSSPGSQRNSAAGTHSVAAAVPRGTTSSRASGSGGAPDASNSSSSSHGSDVMDAKDKLLAACSLAQEGVLSVDGLRQAIDAYNTCTTQYMQRVLQACRTSSSTAATSSSRSSSSSNAEWDQADVQLRLAAMQNYFRLMETEQCAVAVLDDLTRHAASLGELQRLCMLVQRRFKQLHLQAPSTLAGGVQGAGDPDPLVHLACPLDATPYDIQATQRALKTAQAAMPAPAAYPEAWGRTQRDQASSLRRWVRQALARCTAVLRSLDRLGRNHGASSSTAPSTAAGAGQAAELHATGRAAGGGGGGQVGATSSTAATAAATSATAAAAPPPAADGHAAAGDDVVLSAGLQQEAAGMPRMPPTPAAMQAAEAAASEAAALASGGISSSGSHGQQGDAGLGPSGSPDKPHTPPGRAGAPGRRPASSTDASPAAGAGATSASLGDATGDGGTPGVELPGAAAVATDATCSRATPSQPAAAVTSLQQASPAPPVSAGAAGPSRVCVGGGGSPDDPPDGSDDEGSSDGDGSEEAPWLPVLEDSPAGSRGCNSAGGDGAAAGSGPSGSPVSPGTTPPGASPAGNGKGAGTSRPCTPAADSSSGAGSSGSAGSGRGGSGGSSSGDAQQGAGQGGAGGGGPPAPGGGGGGGPPQPPPAGPAAATAAAPAAVTPSGFMDDGTHDGLAHIRQHVMAGHYDGHRHDIALGQVRTRGDDALRIYHLVLGKPDSGAAMVAAEDQLQRDVQTSSDTLQQLWDKACSGEGSRVGMYYLSEDMHTHLQFLTVSVIAVIRDGVRNQDPRLPRTRGLTELLPPHMCLRLIIGDLHGASAGADAVCSIGQAEQLLERDPLAVVTFLGDYFDRGTEPVVTLVKVLLLKLRFPRNVVLLRGNHEDNASGKAHGNREHRRSRQSFHQHLSFVQKAQPQPVAEQQQGLEEAPEQQQQQQQEEGKLTGAAKESYKLIHGNGGLTSWLVCAAVNRDSAQVHGAPTHLPELLLDETISLPLSPADLQKLAESHPAHMCLWGDPHLPEATSALQALVEHLAPPVVQCSSLLSLQEKQQQRRQQGLLSRWDTLRFGCCDQHLGSVKADGLAAEAMSPAYMRLLWQVAAARSMAQYVLQGVCTAVEATWGDAEGLEDQQQQQARLQQELGKIPLWVQAASHKLQDHQEGQERALQCQLSAQAYAAAQQAAPAFDLEAVSGACKQQVAAVMRAAIEELQQHVEEQASDEEDDQASLGTTAVDAVLDDIQSEENQQQFVLCLFTKQQDYIAERLQQLQEEGTIEALEEADDLKDQQLTASGIAYACQAMWSFAGFLGQACTQQNSVRQHQALLGELLGLQQQQQQQAPGAAAPAAPLTHPQLHRVLTCLNSMDEALEQQLWHEERLLSRLQQEQQQRQHQGAPEAGGAAAAAAQEDAAFVLGQASKVANVKQVLDRLCQLAQELRSHLTDGQQLPPSRAELVHFCTKELAGVQPLSGSKWLADAQAPAATWFLANDPVSPCTAPMTPAYWAAWQPRFLQYLQAQRQGLSGLLQQHCTHWRGAEGQQPASKWSEELLGGVAAAGKFLPNMHRSTVRAFLHTFTSSLSGVKVDSSLEELVLPIVDHWPGGSRAFLAPLAYAFTEAMLAHAGMVPEALLQQPRFNWLMLGHRPAGPTGAALHSPHPLPPGTPLSSASLLLAEPGSSASSTTLVINIHTASWISGDTREGSACLVARPHPTAPHHMQLAVARGLGPEGNLTTLLSWFLADQVRSKCVRSWFKGLLYHIQQQEGRAKARLAAAKAAGAAGGAAAATPPAQQQEQQQQSMSQLQANGQQPSVLFDAMLPPLGQQQQQQQAASGAGAPAQPPPGAQVHRFSLGALGGTEPAAMLDKCAFYRRLVEGVEAHGALQLLEQLETVQDVVLAAAQEQQAQSSSQGPPPHVAGLLRHLAAQPLTPANCAHGELAAVQRLRASLEGLQQQGEESRQKRTEGEEAAPQAKFPRVLCKTVNALLGHIKAAEAAAHAAAAAAAAAAAEPAASEGPAAGGSPPQPAQQGQQGHQQEQQQGDGSLVWVFGGLAAPVSPATAQQLRTREAIAAALRQPPEVLDPRYRWLQRLLCGYLVSACCTPPCGKDWARVQDIPFVRWAVSGGQGLQLLPTNVLDEALTYIQLWAKNTGVEQVQLEQLQDPPLPAAAAAGLGPGGSAFPWQRRPAAPGGPLMPYGWHEEGWDEQQLFWAQRFDHIVMCAYGAMMASAVGQVPEQWGRAVRSNEWVVPGAPAALTQEQVAMQQQMQQQVLQVQQQLQQQQQQQQQVLAGQQEQHAAADAGDAMEWDAQQEQQAGAAGVLVAPSSGAAAPDVDMADADGPLVVAEIIAVGGMGHHHDGQPGMPQHQQQQHQQQQQQQHQHQHQQQLLGKRSVPEPALEQPAASGTLSAASSGGSVEQHKYVISGGFRGNWLGTLERLIGAAATNDNTRAAAIQKFCSDRLQLQPAADQEQRPTVVVLPAPGGGQSQPVMELWIQRKRAAKKAKGPSPGTCFVRLLPTQGAAAPPDIDDVYVADESQRANLQRRGLFLTSWGAEVPTFSVTAARNIELLVEVSDPALKPHQLLLQAVLLASAAAFHILLDLAVLPEEVHVQLTTLYSPTKIDTGYTAKCEAPGPAEAALAGAMEATGVKQPDEQ